MEATYSLPLEELLENLGRPSSSNEDLDEQRFKLCENPAVLQTIAAGLEDYSDSENFSQKSVFLQTAKFCAELAKSETCRPKIQKFLPNLANFFLTPNFRPETAYQVYRAIGNICYENDEGREIVLNSGAIPFILKDLEKWRKISSENLSTNGEVQSHSAEISSSASEAKNESNAIRMTTVIFGCLCNLLESNIPCQLAALNSDCGILKIFSEILSNQQLASLHSLLLASLSSISENHENRKMILDSSIPRLLWSMLRQTDFCLASDEIEIALDLLIDLANSDGGLLKLFQNDAVFSLTSILNKEDKLTNSGENLTNGEDVKTNSGDVETNSEDKLINGEDGETNCEDVVTKSGNLLVEFLADSQCIQAISTTETEILLSSAASWLTKSPQKITIAALVIGNLARSKENCERIFGWTDSGENELIPKTLLKILREIFLKHQFVTKSENSPETKLANSSETESENSRPQTDPQMQLLYALLSSLKNLAVEKNFCLRLVDFDLVKILLDGLTAIFPSENSDKLDKSRIPILAKFFTLLRMCASLDEKIATPIGSNFLLLDLTIRFCFVPESIRLLIVLLDKFPQSLTYLREKGVVNCVADLLVTGDASQHMGGLVFATALLNSSNPNSYSNSNSSFSLGKEIVEDFKNSEFLENLKKNIFAEKNSSLLFCGLRFLDKLVDLSTLPPVFTTEIIPVLQKLSDSVDENVRQKANSIIQKIS